MKRGRDRAMMNRMISMETGMVTRATTASSGEMTSIITTVADQHEDVGQHLADGLLEALGQVVDVVGDPAQQIASRVCGRYS